MGSDAALNATQMRVAALIQKSSVTAMEEPHDRKHLLICLLTLRSPAYDVGKNQKIRARKNLAHFFRQDGASRKDARDGLAAADSEPCFEAQYLPNDR